MNSFSNSHPYLRASPSQIQVPKSQRSSRRGRFLGQSHGGQSRLLSSNWRKSHRSLLYSNTSVAGIYQWTSLCSRLSAALVLSHAQKTTSSCEQYDQSVSMFHECFLRDLCSFSSEMAEESSHLLTGPVKLECRHSKFSRFVLL